MKKSDGKLKINGELVVLQVVVEHRVITDLVKKGVKCSGPYEQITLEDHLVLLLIHIG